LPRTFIWSRTRSPARSFARVLAVLPRQRRTLETSLSVLPKEPPPGALVQFFCSCLSVCPVQMLVLWSSTPYVLSCHDPEAWGRYRRPRNPTGCSNTWTGRAINRWSSMVPSHFDFAMSGPWAVARLRRPFATTAAAGPVIAQTACYASRHQVQRLISAFPAAGHAFGRRR
jgi:hypothetical protein